MIKNIVSLWRFILRTSHLAYFLLGLGILVIVFSLTMDLLGIGKAGIQAAQLSGIMAGIVSSFWGWGLLLKSKEEGVERLLPNWKGLLQIDNTSPLPWILTGFLIVFFGLFIVPSTMNPENRFHYFNRFLPEIIPIGRDLMFSTNNILEWLVSGANPYDMPYHVYPPLYTVIFAPLVLLDYPTRFYFMTVLTFICSVILTLLMPVLMKAKGRHSIHTFFFLTVIVSYGMLFEYERGQFNVIAFTLAITAIYLFHYQPSFRHFAYLLFSISIHLKLYPIIFILMFIKDWRDWKGNLLRFAGIGIFNIALLFSVGTSMFISFMNSITTYTSDVWSRPYNLSIRSFIHALANKEIVPFSDSVAAWIKSNLFGLEMFFLIFFGLCLLIVIVKAYKNNEQTINFDLLMVLTIGALIIPSVSIDYKLPLLALPLSLALSQRNIQGTGVKKNIFILLVILASSAYTVTLFPFIGKPTILANNLPMLVVILASIILLNLLGGSALAQTKKLDIDEESQKPLSLM